MSAEICCIVAVDGSYYKASMGPRSDERGNDFQFQRDSARNQASMGPRSDERGNSLSRSRSSQSQGLQWGRAQMSAEMLIGVSWPQGISTLQWGRAQMSAEMRTNRARCASNTNASMGPRSDERGNDLPAYPFHCS